MGWERKRKSEKADTTFTSVVAMRMPFADLLLPEGPNCCCSELHPNIYTKARLPLAAPLW